MPPERILAALTTGVTAGYVLVAGGCSSILLGLFYYVVDVLKYQKWCTPFLWYGMNPITVYLADNLRANPSK